MQCSRDDSYTCMYVYSSQSLVNLSRYPAMGTSWHVLPSKDSGQPAHPRRLCGYTDWFVYSLYANSNLYLVVDTGSVLPEKIWLPLSLSG